MNTAVGLRVRAGREHFCAHVNEWGPARPVRVVLMDAASQIIDGQSKQW